MIIIGIDPSLTATGYFDTGSQIAFTIKTKSERGDARLLDIASLIYDELERLDTFETFAVIEDLPISARAAGKTGMSQGIVREQLLSHGIPYIALPAASLKKVATNNGRADKAAMIAGYREAYPNVSIADDNQADAAWLAECGKALLGFDHKLKCPEALDKYMDRVPIDLRKVAA